jgi:hypothetical protein
VDELIAVPVAIAAAITFGASDVIEQRATHKVAKRPPLDVRLFAELAANRLWLIGITVDISASGMQAIALHFGALALVQPILVLDLLFAVVITAVWERRRPDRVVGAGVLCCTGGLALFLAVARPQSPAVTVAPTILVPLGIGMAGVIALCLVAWRLSPRRFLPLATACRRSLFGAAARKSAPRRCRTPLTAWLAPSECPFLGRGAGRLDVPGAHGHLRENAPENDLVGARPIGSGA